MPVASSTPAIPPMLDITPDSMTNCHRISRRRAPTDLRMPISWVRSVTLASMMFMITIPPTTMNTATSPMVTAKIVPVRFFHARHQGVRRVDPECVVLAIRNVAARAHQCANLVLQLHHVRARPAL